MKVIILNIIFVILLVLIITGYILMENKTWMIVAIISTILMVFLLLFLFPITFVYFNRVSKTTRKKEFEHRINNTKPTFII